MHTPDRRSFLAGGFAAAGALAAGTAAPLAAARPAPRALPDLGFLREERLANTARCRELLQANGYVGYVATRGSNVLYLSNHFPLLARMGAVSGSHAVFPVRADQPLGLVMGQFSYYYTYQESGLALGHVPYLFTGPRGDGEGAADLFMFRQVSDEPLSEREHQRRGAVAAVEPMHASASAALRQALIELVGRRGRIAVDDASVAALIEGSGLELECVVDEDILRAARLAKSPAELKLMQLSSAGNVAAAMAAAEAVREHGTLRAFRWAFYEEAVRRGQRPVFMVVDGVSVDHYDAPLREGQGMLIDCVSELHGYHGDYGRTVLIGEGSARLEATVAAVATAWEEVRQALRPGMSFTQVRALGAETLRKLGHDISVPFVPHSVGLAHTDQPLSARYRPGPDGDLVLLEDMILSVDCPVMDTGIGGTTHLEDLVHITAQGAIPIHDTHQPIVRV